MKWTQITVFTTQEGIEPVCGRLSTLGIDQVQIQESREAIDAFCRKPPNIGTLPTWTS